MHADLRFQKRDSRVQKMTGWPIGLEGQEIGTRDAKYETKGEVTVKVRSNLTRLDVEA